MLLLVVGLVVLVLVIVVVVFLSVRSMHTEDDGTYDVRAARRDTGGRDSAGRDSGARRVTSRDAMNGRGAMDGRGARSSRDTMTGGGTRNGRGPARGEAAAPPRARPARTGQQAPAARRSSSGDAQPDLGGRSSGARRGGGRERGEQRVPALPRPRGFQHDQDGAADWGGVSDEQYWAELSSDKPLTTTARSAQAGPPAAGRLPGQENSVGHLSGHNGAAGRLPGQESPAAADPTQQLRHPAGGSAQFADPQSAAPARGAAGFGDTPFGTPRGAGSKQFRDPAAPDDTNPGRAGSGWAGNDPAGSWAAQDAPTAAWRAADPSSAASQAAEPSTGDWAAGDTVRRGWDAADTPESSWDEPDEVTGDWRADEPSADRWAVGDEPASRPPWETGDALASDAFSLHGARTGGQDQYHAGNGHADYDEPYGSQHPAGGSYQPGELEPLPEPAGRATGWHSAPVPSGGFAADREGHGWGHGGGYDSSPGADQRDGYAGSGQAWEPDDAGRGWAEREPGYGQTGGYHHQDQEYGQPPARAGHGYGEPGDYGLPGSHRGHDQDYGQGPDDAEFPGTSAFDLPAYDGRFPAGRTSHGDGERTGYGQQPRHGSR